jgi:maltose-binding protein MalE
MTIDWSHTLFAYQALWGNHLGVALLPRVQATNRLPHPYVQGNVISINAKVVDQQEQQAALDFISYLLSEESQQTLLEAGKQPVLLTLDIQGTEPLDVAARIFRQQAQIGQAMPTSRVVNNIVRDELERMQLTVLRGLKTPADAVTHTDGALRERLTDGLSKEY